MSTDPAAPAITPALTVGELLRHYPALEEPLACLVPAYRALSTPSLKQTVAAPLPLHQLAATGGVPLDTLISGLRAAAGVTHAPADEAVPSWVAGATPAVTLDARPVLAAGGHPLSTVMQGLGDLGADDIYELITPFVPAPLVDMARGMGFEAFSTWEGEVLHTYFRRRQAGG